METISKKCCVGVSLIFEDGTKTSGEIIVFAPSEASACSMAVAIAKSKATRPVEYSNVCFLGFAEPE